MHPEAATAVISGHSLHRVIHIIAPTALEYVAARLVLRNREVERSGIALQRQPTQPGPVVIVGLAGGLDRRLTPGTVVIPEEVGIPGGAPVGCDAALVRVFREAAESLGFLPAEGRLLTAPTLVTGDERTVWADRGFVAADMETALLAQTAQRFATVRVVLDTVHRTIAAEWLTPTRAMRSPRLWGQLAWMTWAAPRYAVRAARIIEAGLECLGER